MGIRLTDLPGNLQDRYLKLQDEFAEESKPFVALLIWFFQSLLQEPTHGRRLEMLDNVMTKEVLRLQAKASMQEVLGIVGNNEDDDE